MAVPRETIQPLDFRSESAARSWEPDDFPHGLAPLNHHAGPVPATSAALAHPASEYRLPGATVAGRGSIGSPWRGPVPAEIPQALLAARARLGGIVQGALPLGWEKRFTETPFLSQLRM